MATGDLTGYTRGSDGVYRRLTHYRRRVVEFSRDQNGRLLGVWHLRVSRSLRVICREIEVTNENLA